VSGPATISSSTVTLTGAGAVTISASQAANGNYAAATATVNIIVNKVLPNVQVSLSSSSIATSQAFVVAITVTGGNRTIVPTGAVTLTTGGFTSGAVPLTSGIASINIPAGSLAVGSDTLTASYAPDSVSSSDYTGAVATASVTVTSPIVPVAPGITVSPASASISTAQTVAVTIVVAGSSGSSTPTGAVILSGDGYTSAAMTLASGAVTITIPAGSLSKGSDTITATYSPDASSSTIYTSGSGTASITVTNTVYSMAATSVTIAHGAAGTSTVTISSANGYTGTVSLACTITASPAGAAHIPTCTAIQTVSLNSTNTSGTATVNVASTAVSAALASPNPIGRYDWAVQGGVALALLLLPWIPRKRRSWLSLVGILIATSLLSGLVACGGGASVHTTAGNYTVTVTGTGSDLAKTPASTTFTLTVN
jgi:hypothetical protein